MRREIVAAITGLFVMALGAPAGSAYTASGRKGVFSAQGSIQGSSSVHGAIVRQGDPNDTADALNFNDDGVGGTRTLRNSNESIKVVFHSNLVRARVIISTNNSKVGATPQFCGSPIDPSGPSDPLHGFDGSGLVGIPTSGDRNRCRLTVPMLWAVHDDNVTHQFTPAVVGDDEVYLTDRAHVRTLLPASEKKGALDNVPMKFCEAGATHPVLPENARDDGLYPQYFGGGSTRLDLCNAGPSSVVIGGRVINPGERIPEADELSKNIAAVAFNVAGDTARVPNLSTPDPTDSIEVKSPIYIPLAADFRTAPTGVDFGESTLKVELISQ